MKFNFDRERNRVTLNIRKKMNPSIFFILASLFFSPIHVANCAQHNQIKYPALIYKIPNQGIQINGTRNISCFTFCPASTEREKKINDQISISGHGLFLRNVHGPKDNITANICDEPLKPAMVFNSGKNQYEIGYELYFEEDSFKWEDGTYYWEDFVREKSEKNQFGANNRHVYRLVNNENQIINNDRNKECTLNNGSSKLIFHWTSVMNFTSLGFNKQILINDFNKRPVLTEPLDKIVDGLRRKCVDYGLPHMNMKVYISLEEDDDSKESKYEVLPSIEKLQPWNKQSYGSLELSQIIPLWYYNESWTKAASCSSMNMIPVWKTIADGQLRKVDLYIIASIRNLYPDESMYSDSEWYIEDAYFGASAILTYEDESKIDSTQQRKMYAVPENSNFSQIIPIPKIIYRVITVLNNENILYTAIVVLHNDPNPVPDSDRICDKSEEIEGWEAIKNDDPRTGITYVCPYSMPKLNVAHEKLGLQVKIDIIKSLTLHNMEFVFGDVWNWEYREFNATSSINPEFEKLLNITVDV